MPRARKGAARTKARKRILRAARGYQGTNRRHKQQAQVALLRAGKFAYRDRRKKKTVFRHLGIVRINAACRAEGLRYGQFIDGLTKLGILLNRKVLSELAIHNPDAFKELVEKAKAALEA